MSVTVELKHRKLATEIFGCLSTHSAAYLIAEAMLQVRRETLAEISQSLLELGRKWLRESAKAPVRVARYGSKDDLEHCADELEKAIRALAEREGAAK